MFELNKLHKGVSYEEYAAEDGLRASDLKAMKRSPAHFKVYKSAPKEPSEALEFGKIFHAAIERPEWFADSYVVKPKFDRRTKAGKEGAAEFDANVPEGKIVLEHDWVEPMTGMLKSALSHKLVGNLLKKGVRETSLWTEDEETGLLLQCRPDYISERGIGVDIKTTRDASEGFFMNQIFGMKNAGDPMYSIQASHYTHCAKMSKTFRHESFVFIAIEKEAPYGIKIYPMDSGCLDAGERWRSTLTRKYAECLNADHWPAYDEAAVPVTVPQWVDIPSTWGVE